MATYEINEGYAGERTVEADYFRTEGDFVDFYARNGHGDQEVVLRVRANWVQKIELVKSS
ncbi:hypothetical protein ACWDOR_23775 [Streptosporangium canum]